jgi:hypothetical protein
MSAIVAANVCFWVKADMVESKLQPMGSEASLMTLMLVEPLLLALAALAFFKRGVIGTYHHLSEAHLHRYTAEFDFRYNTKDISDRERADKCLIGSFGKRLTYRRTAALAA